MSREGFKGAVLDVLDELKKTGWTGKDTRRIGMLARLIYFTADKPSGGAEKEDI